MSLQYQALCLTCCVCTANIGHNLILLSPQGPKPKDYLKRGEKEGVEFDYEDKINFAVFPSLQVPSLPLQLCLVVCSTLHVLYRKSTMARGKLRAPLHCNSTTTWGKR